MNTAHTNLSELQHALQLAHERLDKAINKNNLDAAGWHEFDEAFEAALEAERRVAAAKGEEYLIPLDFPVQWDVGAPLPHLLQNDNKTFLIFYLKDHDPNWDGSYVTIRRPSDPSPSRIAVVEFKLCSSAKLGCPNDEVLEGHPWHGKGMKSYSAQEVTHSHWLAATEAINSVHSCYDPSYWKRLHHYVFWFHDSTFECLAESFHVSLHSKCLPEVLAEICSLLVE